MQSLGTISPVMVKAPNLVHMRLISYRSIIELGTFQIFIFLAEFRYAPFTQRLLNINRKLLTTYFPVLFISETDHTAEKTSKS